MIAKTELRPRVMGALGVVALSLFLLICLMSYGQGGFADAGRLGWQAWIGSLLLEVFGAGAYVLVLSPLAWGVVVYFQERTPQLRLRAAGTVVLAISVAVIAGMLQGGQQDIWAGAVGSAAAAVVGWVSTLVGPPIAQAGAWTLAIGVFVVSLVVATDWVFHTLRRGGRPAPARFVAPPLPPAPVPDVAEDVVADEERRRVIEAALVASVDDEPEEAIEEEEIVLAEPLPAPQAGETPAREPHLDVQAAAYAGVEFMPPSDELAVPGAKAPGPSGTAYVSASIAEPGSIDDEWLAVEPIDEPATAPAGPEHTAAPAGRGGDLDDAAIAPEHDTADVVVASEQPAFDPLVRPLSTVQEEAGVIDEEYVSHRAPNADDEVEPVPVPAPVATDEAAPVLDEYFAVESDDAHESRSSGIAPAGIAAEILDGESVGSREAEAPEPVEAPGFGTRLPFDAPLPAQHENEPTAREDEPAPGDADVPPNRLSERMIVDDLVVSAEIHELDQVALGDANSAPAEDAFTPEDEQRSLDGVELDALFRPAVDVVLTREKASAMVLQRHLNIGYPRAVRLLEEMTVAGIIGPDESDWSGARRILVTREEWDAFIAAHSA